VLVDEGWRLLLWWLLRVPEAVVGVVVVEKGLLLLWPEAVVMDVVVEKGLLLLRVLLLVPSQRVQRMVLVRTSEAGVAGVAGVA